MKALALQSLRTVFGIGRSARAKFTPFGLLAISIFPALAASLFAAATGDVIQFITHQQYFASTSLVYTLFCASQAPELVGTDQQYRVLSLYFSRALRRGDYVAAKVGALITALLILSITPQLILLFGRAFANENPLNALRTDAHYIGPIFASAIMIAALFASLSLLLASVTRRRFLATSAIIGVMLITNVAANLLVRVGGGSLKYSIFTSPMLVGEGVTLWLFNTAVHPRSTFGRVNLPGFTYGIAALSIAIIASLFLYWRYKRVQT
jgi:ABC-2 type transport system permease protein